MLKINLNGGKATVLPDGWEHLAAYRWTVTRPREGKRKTYYAYRHAPLRDGKRRTVFLHRVIMGVDGCCPELEVHHIDGNGLHNDPSNLQVLTKKEHKKTMDNRTKRKPGQTSSDFIGITWVEKVKEWQAQIQIKGRDIYLGLYKKEKDAAKAYDNARIGIGLEPVNFKRTRAKPRGV